ncbi:Nitrous oxide reductase [Macrophomina phaseolina MS6]|uniref:Nitrous oxide reductase n=1 Tax=Macrophomina phaseolina (strain MS6) TaxID=1126212 RepID=K2SBY6_MACPH|nr:Nitrous oxide reductase [Macrophomina phaseolina MS6]
MQLGTQYLLILLEVVGRAIAQAQAPAEAGVGSAISSRDRIYTGDQSSNTITVIDPIANTVLGTISLGATRLSDLIGPQYIRSVNSHGLGFSRDGKYIVSTSVTSNTVTVIRTLDNSIVSQTFTDRQAHEAFFAADNRTIWVGTRGVDHVTVVDGIDGGVLETIPSYGGPSKVLFSPDGTQAYVNHIRAPYIHVLDVATHKTIANITGLNHTFSSDMMLSADGKRLWVAHKVVGTVTVISTVSKEVISVLPTGPETNHPNFAVINGSTYGFVTVAAEDSTKVYQQSDSEKPPTFITTIQSTGVQPHGLWPSADNTRLYIVNEHSDSVDVIDLTSSEFEIVHTVDVGQEGQALVYVSNAVTSGNGTQNLGSQGLLNRPTVNILVRVNGSESHPNATALVTVRPEAGLDMFQVIGRSMKLNATYEISATCQACGGVKIPLLEFTAAMPIPGEAGCATAPQVLGFFKFTGVYDLDSLEVYEK